MPDTETDAKASLFLRERLSMEIPNSYREVIEPLIAKARGFLEAGESLSPFAFVGNFSTKQILPVLINTKDEDAKDRAALAIQMAAAQTDADFIFTIIEAWGLPKDKLPRHQEILHRYGSLANSPYKIDTVGFMLETRYGMWGAQMPLKPKGRSKKKRTFGEVTFQFLDGAVGRFAGLLPVPDDAPSGGAPLH